MILLKMIIKDILFEKKKREILLQEIYILQSIKNVFLSQKKAKEVLEGKNVSLILLQFFGLF